MLPWFQVEYRRGEDLVDRRERLDEQLQLQQQLAPAPAVDMDMSDTEMAGKTSAVSTGSSCGHGHV